MKHLQIFAGALILSVSAFAQKPAALPPGVVAQGEFYVSQIDGAQMVYVPPGEFTVGLAPGTFPGAEGSVVATGVTATEKGDLSATHVKVISKELFRNVPAAQKVATKGFFIDRFEVSNRRYKKFIDATKHALPTLLPAYAAGTFAAFSWPKGSWFTSADPIYDAADYPVACVTWADAMAYAKWAGKTLPTEVQWERAARGTNDTSFPWGNDWLPDNVNSVESGDRATRPCGGTPGDKSGFGVMDLAGNVAEWCLDEYSDTMVLPAAPPPAPASTNAAPADATATNAPAPATTSPPAPTPPTENPNAPHVIRGGNWAYFGFVQSRAWYRRSNADESAVEPGPVPRSVTIGFRCVISEP